MIQNGTSVESCSAFHLKLPRGTERCNPQENEILGIRQNACYHSFGSFKSDSARHEKNLKQSFLLQPSVNLFIGLSKLSIKLQHEECHGTPTSTSRHPISITVYMWGVIMSCTEIVYRVYEPRIPCVVRRKILNSVTCVNEYI